MRSNPPHFWNDTANRCAICGKQFGLVRHYSWRTALCSRKCCDRFQTREQSDRAWLGVGGRDIHIPVQAWSCF
jgi:hypothetical protein